MAKDAERTAYNEVFISYSRKNKEFAERLVEAIYTGGNQNVWIDWEDIEFAADWWEKIKSGIDSANNFVFLISPDSIESKVCFDEVDHAFKMGKRIIPVMHQEITDKDVFAKMHPVISQHNWLPFRENDDFDTGMKLLLQTIQTDVKHVQFHTRLITRAKDWDHSGRNNSRLLTIGEHREAIQWLGTAETQKKVPEPIELQREFLRTSQNFHRRRQQATWAAIAVGLVIAALAVLSTFLFQNAQSNLTLAEARGTEAVAQANIAATNAEEAVAQANIAATQAALASNNEQTAIALQGQAEDSAATATNAQGEAVIQANLAATQAVNAENNAATATNAQGEALVQANLAATEARNAENNAATATIAQGEALVQANLAATQAINAENNAATATNAQGEALVQANLAATQARNALNNAATATIAQGEALFLAATSDALRSTSQVLAATSDTLRLTAEGDALVLGQTAVAALGTSEYRGTRVAEESQLAANNASTAESAAATSDANAVLAAENERISRAQALAVSAEQLLDAGDLDLALPLSFESINLNSGSTYAQGILNRTVSLAPWLDLSSRNAGYTPSEAAFTPDGRYMMSYNREDIAIYIWDLDSRSLHLVLRPHAAYLTDIRISADSRYLITSSLDATVVLSDIATGAVVQRLYFDYYVTSVDMSPDGLYLAVLTQVLYGDPNDEALQNRVQIYDVNTWERVEIPSAVPRGYNRWRFNREGDLLIAPAMGILDLTEFSLSEISWELTNLFGGEAPYVRTTNNWRTTSYFDFRTRQVDFENSLAWVSGSGLWPDYGQGSIVSTGNPQILDLHNIQVRSNLNSNAFEWDSQTATFMDFSSDGARILLGTGQFSFPQGVVQDLRFATWQNRRLFLVDVASGGIITQYTTDASQAVLGRFSPDRSQFATVNENGRIDIWDTETGALLRTVGYTQQNFGFETVIEATFGYSAFRDTLQYSPDGRYLTDGVAVWNLEAAFTDIAQRITLNTAAADVSFNPDGSALYVASGSDLEVYDIATGSMSSENYLGNSIQGFQLDANRNQVLMTLSRSIQLSAGGSYEQSFGQVLLWDVSSSSEIQRSSRGGAIAYSADGNLALIHNQLWDLQNNTVLQTFSTPELDGYMQMDTGCQGADDYNNGFKTLAGAISPDNQRVILSFNFDSCLDVPDSEYIGDRRLVLLFDVATRAVLADLTANLANYERVGAYVYRGDNDDFFAFSPDGSLILSGQNLYDALTGEVIASFNGHTGHVNHMEFSPDGRFAASASDDRTVILWDVQTTRPIRQLLGHTGPVQKVHFSPDGRFLVSLGGVENNEVIVWALQSLDDLLNQVETSLDVRQLTCFERQQYGVQPLCSDAEYQPVLNDIELPELPTFQVRIFEGAELFAVNSEANNSRGGFIPQTTVIGTTESEVVSTVLATEADFYGAYYQITLEDGSVVWVSSSSTRVIPPS